MISYDTWWYGRRYDIDMIHSTPKCFNHAKSSFTGGNGGCHSDNLHAANDDKVRIMTTLGFQTMLGLKT